MRYVNCYSFLFVLKFCRILCNLQLITCRTIYWADAGQDWKGPRSHSTAHSVTGMKTCAQTRVSSMLLHSYRYKRLPWRFRKCHRWLFVKCDGLQGLLNFKIQLGVALWVMHHFCDSEAWWGRICKGLIFQTVCINRFCSVNNFVSFFKIVFCKWLVKVCNHFSPYRKACCPSSEVKT